MDRGGARGRHVGLVSQPESRWIDTPAALAAVIGELRDAPIYALDTEFHRERTYYPKVALVQIAWAGSIALIDPLAIDIAPLAQVLDGPGLCVLHAAQQDLEVLGRACGTIPSQLFDTQIAAGFLGYATPSLANLLAGEMGLTVPKGDRLTDWLARPLTEGQKQYAASDVAHLIELHDILCAKLERLGRLEWAIDECEVFRNRPVGPVDPVDAWTRLKDVRTLKGKARGVASAVAAWRERRAAQLDQPVRFVLADLAILGIAQKAPRSLESLRATRGLEDRHARGATGNELLAAIEDGLAADAVPPSDRDGDDLDRSLRPAVTLVSAWVSQLARDQKIDTTLLATRSDLVALLSHDPEARLSKGWRAATVGDGIRKLVEGRAALAFDPRGNLKLLDLPEAEVAVLQSAVADELDGEPADAILGGDPPGDSGDSDAPDATEAEADADPGL